MARLDLNDNSAQIDIAGYTDDKVLSATTDLPDCQMNHITGSGDNQTVHLRPNDKTLSISDLFETFISKFDKVQFANRVSTNKGPAL